jgi:hypothetical protein
MTTRNRMILLTGMGAAALALFAAPAPADADSRRHVFKPDQNVVEGITRDSVPGAIDAPEIDPAAIGLGLALAVGGLAILANRRRSSAM